MPSKTEHHASICNVKTLNRGLKVWWVREVRPFAKGWFSEAVVIGAAVVALAIIVHVFFPLGLLLSAALPGDTQTYGSYLAFDYTPEVIVPLTSLGAAPFMAMAMLASWARHVCSLGKSIQ